MEQHETEVDVVVVGGGSAGSTAAIRAQAMAAGQSACRGSEVAPFGQ